MTTNVLEEGGSNVDNNVVLELQPLNEKVDVLTEDKTNAGESQTINKKSSKDAPFSEKTLKSMARFGSIGALIFLSLVAVFTIAQVVIGLLYTNDCPINAKIPHHLVMAGAVELTATILLAIQGVIAASFIEKPIKDAENNRNARILAISLKLIANILFFLAFYLILLAIFGLMWGSEIWNKVQYNQSSLANYCHPTLYRFTCSWLLLAFIGLILLTLAIRDKCLN